MFAQVQTSFAQALRDPALAAPAALATVADLRPEKRFAVYRNNVAVGLIGAIGARFSAVGRIVGPDFFSSLARAYVAEHPPRSPLMMVYGDDFPDFIEAAPGLDELPYLADVARLEAARTRAYHAADAVLLGADAFAGIDPATLGDLTVALHPSIEIVRSPHPIVTIWAMNTGEAELAPVKDWSAEDALVARPDMDVVVHSCPPGGAAFLLALGRGAALGEAAAEAADADEAFDLTRNLVGLIEAGLAVGLSPAQGASS